MSGVHATLGERAGLLALARELGPDAPTLCEGWDVADLIAHLHIREHRPDAALGLTGKGPFAAHTEKVQAAAAARVPFEALVSDLESGIPRWWPGRYRPEFDLHEWFVHHEDVRRANGLGPRTDAGLDAALAGILPRWGRVLTRRAKLGIVLALPDGTSLSVSSGTPEVVLRGAPGEILLRLFGRPSVAQVTVEGDAAAVAAFEAAPLGL